MKEHIKVAFDESHQRFGANKITAVLSKQGIYASPKYVRGLIGEMGLQSTTRCSKRDYQKWKQMAQKQNVLQRKFRVDKPNQVWVSDVACVRINESIYMSVRFLIFFEEGRGLQSIP